MWSMISGHDVTFDVHALRADPAIILVACARHWPEALYQKADEEETRPIAKMILYGDTETIVWPRLQCPSK
jgi:hypothetical protein